MARNNHPKKEIRDAIDHALSFNWTLKMAGKSGHIWGTLYCPAKNRAGCKTFVYGTPRVVEDHARHIIKSVNRCDHDQENEK